MADRCLFCDEPATAWCDQAIGTVWTGEMGKVRGQAAYRVTSLEAMLSHSYTCDAPCCARHAHVAGFICGTDPDTIDRCSGCQETSPRAPLLTPHEIDDRRRKLHVQYRRAQIVEVPKARQALTGEAGG